MEPLLGSTPSSAGDLRSTPLATVLVELLETEDTGTLFIHDEAGKPDAAIWIEAGFPVGVKLEASPNAPTAGTNMLQTLIPLCSRSVGVFRFVPGQRLDDGGAPQATRSRIDPLALIMAASRGPLREDAVEQVMVALARNLVRLNPRANIERYALTDQERSIADAVANEPIDLVELRKQSDAPERVLRRVLYVLRVTHALTLMPLVRRTQSGTVEHAQPLPERPQSSSAYRKVSSPNNRAVSGPLLDAPFVPGNPTVVISAQRGPTGPLSNAPQQNPSGAPVRRASSQATPPAIPPRPPSRQVSGEQPASRGSAPSMPARPDSAPLSGSPAARTLLEQGAGRYSVALPDHGTTSAFGRSSRPPDGSRKSERPDPEACFARAEKLMKQREYAAALQAANEALRMGGDRADHEALYAWLLCLQGSGSELAVHPRAMGHLDRALRRDPLCERAHHYKGMVLKRLGRADEAHNHFLRAMQVNRDNLEAAREVRLYDMRKRTRDSRPSLVSKLLKRFGDNE